MYKKFEEWAKEKCGCDSSHAKAENAISVLAKTVNVKIVSVNFPSI